VLAKAVVTKDKIQVGGQAGVLIFGVDARLASLRDQDTLMRMRLAQNLRSVGGQDLSLDRTF